MGAKRTTDREIETGAQRKKERRGERDEVERRTEAKKYRREAFDKLTWTIEHRVLTVPWESATSKQCTVGVPTDCIQGIVPHAGKKKMVGGGEPN